MPAEAGRPPRRVLISCLRLLGDVVLSLPLLDMVKTAHPDCEVDYLVPAGMGDFLKGDPRVRRVIEHRRHGKGYLLPILMRYDWAFATNGSDRSVMSVAAAGRRKRIAAVDARLPAGEWWKRLALTHPVTMPARKPVIRWCVHLARAAGLEPDRCRGTLHRSPAHVAAAQDLLRAAGIGSRGHFVFHPMSRHPYKEWPMSRVVETSDRIAATHGLRPVWTGGGSDRERQALAQAAASATIPPLVCAGTLDLNTLACVVAEARAFVGVDTAVTHVAATTDVPMVALFGPTPVWAWAPWNNRNPPDHAFPDQPGSFRDGHVRVLQDGAAFAQEHATEMDTQAPSASMAALTVEQVLAEVDHLLSPASVHSGA